MIAEYLRTRARWRLDRADENDGGANARSAIGLIDAAAYAESLQDSDRLIVRLTVAGCFAMGRYTPGVEGERMIRFWHYDDPEGDPGDLFEALMAAAEKGLVPLPRGANA
jgi:hypothetical protein